MRRDYYERLLDEIGAETIARYDREESGAQWRGVDEATQDNGYFTFGKLDRGKQVDILRALDENLPTRTKRPNTRTGSSYALKHTVERFTGFYVSNLQTKTAMRILGYQRSTHALNPFFNVTVREWRAFEERARYAADMRGEARRRMNRQSEARKAASYFTKYYRTA